MAITWYSHSCSPKIKLRMGTSASGAVILTTYSLRKVKSNTWDTSLKGNMNNILEEIAKSGLFAYPVYRIECINTYHGDY